MNDINSNTTNEDFNQKLHYFKYILFFVYGNYTECNIERIPNLSAEQSDGITVFRIPIGVAPVPSACRVLGNVHTERFRSLPFRQALSHIAKQTVDLLITSGVKLMTQPPYSPDLKPYDFFLFATINKKITRIVL
ncbi:hypothetical protein ANN_18870 [Periplaneta americana]|uniref:Uncharacterized protein n=1 Tax=Periplaneta americana TaxID=6978 RepID=A0ABQ8SPZ6_PERAM|nr:hypothetical protein ANN_18870 [Periplaneta americana]